MVKFSRNRRNGTKQEKHSGKGIAVALATALFLNFSVKSLARKVDQKFWGEVPVLNLPLRKKKLFSFQLQICGSSSACRKKTRCRRMTAVPPFWDICQWQNFPGNLNIWPNTSLNGFFLLPFLQPKKIVQKYMLLYWFCLLRGYTSVTLSKKKFFSLFNSLYCQE